MLILILLFVRFHLHRESCSEAEVVFEDIFFSFGLFLLSSCVKKTVQDSFLNSVRFFLLFDYL